MTSKIKEIINNTSISKKLLLANLFVIVLPLSLLYVFISSRLIEMSSTQYIDTTRNTVMQTASYLSYKLNGAENIADATFYDPEKYRLISQDPDLYSLPDQVFDSWRLSNYFDSLIIIDETIHIHLYVNDDYYYANEEVIFHPYSRVSGSDWLNSLVDEGKESIWINGDKIDSSALIQYEQKATLSVVRRVIDQNDYTKTVAVIRVDLPMDNIRQIMQGALSAEGSHVWLVDQDGNILVSGYDNANDIPDAEKTKSYIGHENWESATIDNQNYLLSTTPIEQTGLYLIAAFPQSVPRHQSDNIRLQFFFIVMIVMLAAVLMSWRFTKTISSRLNGIMMRMRLVRKGDMEPIEEQQLNDEIGELANTYNYMVEQINKLAAERYELGREALRHEMSALQGQIKPHFLYNVLDLINLTALKEGLSDVAVLVRMLARFYKIGLNKGKDTILVRDELEHVSIYLEMQNKRFDDRIKYTIDVEEEIQKAHMLKIIFQPIVENSIIHGILPFKNKQGLVNISGKIHDDNIIFTVSDNGSGIEQEKISDILDKEGSGYGLYNIHRRLCIFYGTKYGLEIKSVKDEGTTVIFKIPYKK